MGPQQGSMLLYKDKVVEPEIQWYNHILLTCCSDIHVKVTIFFNLPMFYQGE